MGAAAALLCACLGLTVPATSTFALATSTFALATSTLALVTGIATASPPLEEGCVQGSASDPAVREIIRSVFGAKHARDAITIALCESGAKGTRAESRLYSGLFQLDRPARKRYGHSPCAIDQVRAAHRYFVESGHRWSAWGRCRRRLR